MTTTLIGGKSFGGLSLGHCGIIRSSEWNSTMKETTVFILIERKQKNNFESGLRTIRVKTIPGSEFSCVN